MTMEFVTQGQKGLIKDLEDEDGIELYVTRNFCKVGEHLCNLVIHRLIQNMICIVSLYFPENSPSVKFFFNAGSTTLLCTVITPVSALFDRDIKGWLK